MKLRVFASLITLLAAGLGAALWQERAARAELAAQATRLSRQLADLRYEAKQAARQAETFGRQAVALDVQLGSAKTRTTATESRQLQLTRELSQREEREVALLSELATLRQKLDEPAADAILRQNRIAALEQQLSQLLTRALAGPAGPAAEEPPAPYQVVRVGPADAFVVLDYGAAQGARPGDILSLWRGTSPLARVQISEVRPGFSLAQVLPADLKGQLQTGDLVVLTN